MKKWFLLIGILCMGLDLFAAGAGDYRDFLSTDGKAMRGRVVRFDVRTQKVTIERDNKKIFTVPVDVFCEDDQTYILEWNQAKDFLSDSSFKISAGRFEEKVDEGYSASYVEKKVEECGYKVVLENRSKTKISNVSLDYCIYYEQDEVERYKQKTNEGVLCSSLDVGDMLAKSNKELKTDTVKIYRRSWDADGYFESDIKNVQKGKINGIWVKVSMKTKTGQVFTRDYMLPDSLNNKRSWTKETVAVGENSSSSSRKKKKKKN